MTPIEMHNLQTAADIITLNSMLNPSLYVLLLNLAPKTCTEIPPPACIFSAFRSRRQNIHLYISVCACVCARVCLRVCVCVDKFAMRRQSVFFFLSVQIFCHTHAHRACPPSSDWIIVGGGLWVPTGHCPSGRLLSVWTLNSPGIDLTLSSASVQGPSSFSSHTHWEVWKPNEFPVI